MTRRATTATVAFLSRALSSPKLYANIKVPEELAKEIDKILVYRKLGYRSRAEFIIEATRQKLLELEKAKA